MIIYFADREMRILGHATSELRKGFVITEDQKIEDVETGVMSFSCRIGFTKEKQTQLEKLTDAGNYLLRSNDGENEFYTIIDSEIDTKNQEIYIYAEDAGLDLLNSIADAFEADSSYPAKDYINPLLSDSGFEIGDFEIPADVKRKLKWESEATVTERLASIAKQFGDYEITYSFVTKGLAVTHKYVNFYKQRGKDEGVQLRLNKEIDRIITSKTVANLATAFKCEGGIPEDKETPITLKGYKYDDGDFYVDNNGVLKSRNAVAKWWRYIWETKLNKMEGYEGHIVRPYSYNTTSQQELCSHAVTELKKYCDMEVNYEVDIKRLPEGVKVGDRVNIIDDAGELYLSTRLLLLETSVIDNKYTATLGEHIIKKSGISQKVSDLAAEFAKSTVSVERALTISNAAKEQAAEALAQAEAANEEVIAATAAAEEAQAAAEVAKASAVTAEAQALAAEAAVGRVESSVQSIQTTVENAQKAADNAEAAAETAEAKAAEAATSASNAEADAAEAATAAGAAQSASEGAVAKANTAIGTADEAKATAQSASDTAAAAKLDAEQAEKDVAAFGQNLETIKSTMSAQYARKTELTEAKADLKSQIERNAGLLSSTISRSTVIDETTNAAESLAKQAQAKANKAKELSDEATEAAEAAQIAADEASAAAASAQNEADIAQAAADTAQSVADQAAADLEAARADLATIQGRVDATEEEIAAAEKAVADAKEAANVAIENATTALETAINAQAAADAAQKTADTAKANADIAALNAKSAQSLANETAAAYEAQKTADTAVTNAATAQNIAASASEIASIAADLSMEAVNQSVVATYNADSAGETAATAKSDAAAAQATADEAKEAADAAKEVADKAEEDLEAAKANLEAVKGRVGATEEEIAAAQQAVIDAQAAANLAKAEADDAWNKANLAEKDAAAAVQKANLADAMATDASNMATKATNDAYTAKKNANQAISDAAAAQATADEAKSNANAAQIFAMESATTSLGAKIKAEEADAKVIQAQADLETAKQNLADTLARVDATEEEIAAAQQAVIDAQAAADLAKAEAEAAQATADEAKSNADAAQQAADDAQDAADNAQEAANEAKEAADKAQADADALAIRVTTAETNITQTNARIDLCATKKEFNDLSIGGRNLLLNTRTFKGSNIAVVENRCTLADDDTYKGGQIADCKISFNATMAVFSIRELYFEPDAVYTLSFDAKAYEGENSGANNISVGFSRPASNDAVFYPSKIETSTGLSYENQYSAKMAVTATEWQRYWVKFTTKANADQTEEICLGFSLICYSSLTQTQIGFANFKLEKGNKATEWTPAPEDVTAEMLTEVEQVRGSLTDAKSEIITEAEGITLQTLERYTSKDEHETLRKETETSLSILNGSIDMRFKTTDENIEIEKNRISEFEKRISFTENGIEIADVDVNGKKGMKLILDNTEIRFEDSNGQKLGSWDGEYFYTGSIHIRVDETARFGSFAFVPRSDGSLMFLKVGD